MTKSQRQEKISSSSTITGNIRVKKDGSKKQMKRLKLTPVSSQSVWPHPSRIKLINTDTLDQGTTTDRLPIKVTCFSVIIFTRYECCIKTY